MVPSYKAETIEIAEALVKILASFGYKRIMWNYPTDDSTPSEQLYLVLNCGGSIGRLTNMKLSGAADKEYDRYITNNVYAFLKEAAILLYCTYTPYPVIVNNNFILL